MIATTSLHGCNKVRGVATSNAALHSYKIEFIHPIFNQLIVKELKLPEDMNKIIDFR